VNIAINLHNVIVIVGIAILGILAFRMLAKVPQVSNVPVVGSVVRTAAAA
jgi:hypothetical protein